MPTHRSAAADPTEPPVSAWHTLREALRPTPNRSQLMIGVLCAFVGFAFVVQAAQTDEANLSALSQDELVRILDETTSRSDDLAREAAELQNERDELLSGSDRRQAALEAAERNAAAQGILTGRLPAQGPGVRVLVTDTGGTVRPLTLLNVLEELRNAGAEAIALNDTRVTASSAFTGNAGEVNLDGVRLVSPYVWVAIGDGDTIATALEIPGGALATARRDGAHASVQPLDEVTITALREPRDLRYATPVPAQTP